jgi:5-methylcytosine-specific restriction endonuclease McrA
VTPRTFRKSAEKYPSRKYNGKNYCRYCGRELAGRKTSFCNYRCIADFLIHTDSTQFRNYIIARDAGICQLCGFGCAHNGIVHHIVSIANGGSEFDERNAILVCKQHHDELHSIESNKTKEKFKAMFGVTEHVVEHE